MTLIEFGADSFARADFIADGLGTCFEVEEREEDFVAPMGFLSSKEDVNDPGV